jgi:hypothetical protein
MQVDKGWFFIPVICEETGWYGAQYSYFFPKYLDETTARKYAFIYLEQKVNSGECERRQYASS